MRIVRTETPWWTRGKWKCRVCQSSIELDVSDASKLELSGQTVVHTVKFKCPNYGKFGTHTHLPGLMEYKNEK